MKQYWSMTEGVFNCLIDEVRTIAFRNAIESVVKPGDIVVDIGTGSGILAMIAAKAGASKVYAMEIDPENIRTLQSTFDANGLSEKIEIINADATSAVIPGNTDVVIAEMIATGLIEELQIPVMNNVLKYVSESTKILLNTYDTYIDLVYNNDQFYGFSVLGLRYEYPEESALNSIPYSSKRIVSHVDFSRETVNTTVNKSIPLEIQKDGAINAIRLSGLTTFFDGSTLSGTSAYSYPLLLPITQLMVKSGETYLIRISYQMASGLNTLNYEISKN